ncbi:MAG: cytochrome c3 family protein [Coriobacteriia bacterium]
MSEQAVLELFQRLRSGLAAVGRQLPRILENPRAYPSESMLLAFITVLLLVFVVLIFFALLDVARDWGRRKALGMSVKRRGRWMGVPIGIGIAVLVAFALALSPLVPAAGRACRSCHAIRGPVVAWESGAHSAVSCYSCHTSGGVAGALSASASGLVRVAFGRDSAAQAGVGSSACLGCHESVRAGVLEGPVRMRHADVIEVGMLCGECHPETGHEAAQESPAIERRIMSVCLTCHDGVGAFADCTGCHAQGGPLDVGEMPTDPGTTQIEFTCRGCHSQALSEKCITCHGLEMPHPQDFGRGHAGASAASPSMCARCHELASAAQACGCHNETNVHGTYSEWFPQHSTRAIASGRTGCNCHKLAFCAICHDTDPYR